MVDQQAPMSAAPTKSGPPQSNGQGGTSRSLFFNSVSTFARLGGTFIIGLILAPYLGRADIMGLRGLGLYALLGSSMGLVSILQVTVRSSLVRELSAAFHAPDRSEMPRQFTAAVVASVLLAGALTPIAAGLTPVVVNLFNVPAELTADFSWSWLALVGLAAVMILTTPFTTLFDAMNRVPTGNLIYFMEGVARLVAAAIFVFPVGRAHPVLAYIAAMVIITIVLRVIASVWAYISCRPAQFRWRHLERSNVRRMFQTGGYVVQQEAATNLYDRTNQLLLNLFLGAVVNGLFFYVLLLVGYTKQIANGLCHGIEPIAARCTQTADDRGQASIGVLILTVTRVSAGVLFPIIAVMIVLCHPLVDVWVGDHLTKQDRPGANNEIATMIVILLIGSPLFAVMQGTLRIMLGAGDVRRYAPKLLLAGLVQAVGAVTVLAAARWLLPLWGIDDPLVIQRWGMYGVAGSMSAVYLATYGLYIPLLACGIYNIGRRQLFVGALVPGIVSGLAVACLTMLTRRLVTDWSLATLAAASLPGAATGVVVLWWGILRAEERRRVRQLVTGRRSAAGA